MPPSSSPTYSNAHEPQAFWSRVPSFFLFPLNPTVLLRVALFGVIPAVGVYATSIPAMAIAVGGLTLLAWIFFTRYASRVLSETARGRLSPDQYSLEEDPTLSGLPYRIFGLYFVTALVVGFVASLFGEAGVMLGNVLIVLTMPAALMVLVQTRSLMSGLNPSNSWALMTSIGKPYLLLILFLFCLSSAQTFLTFWLIKIGVTPLLDKLTALQSLAIEARSPADAEHIAEQAMAFETFLKSQRPRLFMMVFGFTAVGMYFTLIAFNMMGYVLYQFHAILGLEVDETRPGRWSNSKPQDPESDRIAALIAAGEMDAALDIAYEAQRTAPGDVNAQERYHKLLHLAGKNERMFSHANRFMALLISRNMSVKALEVLRRCREKDAAFRPEDPKTILDLAQAARKARDVHLALDIVRSFDRRFPRNPMIPDVYSLSARILCEDFRQDAMADRIFATICKRYPDHPCAKEAKEYRVTLARMQSQASPA